LLEGGAESGSGKVARHEAVPGGLAAF
jgi:hypothetical protein